MRLSMWSSYLFDLNPEEMVKTFSQRGWSYSELSEEHALMLLERGKTERVGAEFRTFAEGEGFSFPQGHLWMGVDIAAQEETDRRFAIDNIKIWCDLFNAIGITASVLHPGGHRSVDVNVDPVAIREWQVAGLNEIAAHTKGTPLTVCLENVRQPNAKKADDLLRLVEDVTNDSFGICLDTGHHNILSADKDCAKFIHKTGDKLKALHIADNLGRNDDHILPYGKGTVDWEKTMLALKEAGCEALFNFEVSGENKCPMGIRLIKLDYALQLAKVMAKYSLPLL